MDYVKVKDRQYPIAFDMAAFHEFAKLRGVDTYQEVYTELQDVVSLIKEQTTISKVQVASQLFYVALSAGARHAGVENDLKMWELENTIVSEPELFAVILGLVVAALPVPHAEDKAAEGEKKKPNSKAG